MRKPLAIIHQESYPEMTADSYWVDSNCFWGVDGRGQTVEEATSNFLSNVVAYCHNYYQLELWQLDNRVTQLDHVDQVLTLVTAGQDVANYFQFQTATPQALAS